MSFAVRPGSGGREVQPSPPGRRTERIALLLVVAAWLVFMFPAFTGKARFPIDLVAPDPAAEHASPLNPELGDAVFAMYPWHAYLAERLGDGEVPLWDPYRFAGTPFAANSAPGVWYPPNWLYATGDLLFSFTAIAVGSILAALLLAFWFFRVLRLHPYAAALGAIVFVYSAALYRYSANEPVFGSSMWLPLALGGLEVARRGRPRRGVVLSGAGLALSLLAGHAQIALCVWLVTAVWAASGLLATLHAGRRAGRPRLLRELVGEAAPVVGAFAVAAGIAAIQLLPTAELAGEIVRQETGFEVARLTALPEEHLPTLLVPDYQGSPLDGNYAGPGVNYTETALYAGLLTLPLALIGVVRRPGRVAAFFLAITVIGFLSVLATPAYRLVLALPGFSRTLFATRFVLLIDVGLAGLAALGLHSLLERPDRRTLLVGLSSCGALLALLAWLTTSRPGTTVDAGYVVGRGVRAIAVVAAGAALLAVLARYPSARAAVALALVAVTMSDLWLFGHRLNAFHTVRPVFVRTPAIEALAAVPGPRPRFANVGNWWVPPNGELIYRLHGISGYDPFVPRRVVELVSVSEDQRLSARSNFFGPFTPAVVPSAVLDLLGVATVTTGPDDPLPGPTRFAGPFRGHARPTAFPAAWLAPCWELARPGDVLAEVAAMTSDDLAGTAVVADEGDAAVALRRLGPADPDCARSGGAATVTRYEPERVAVRVDDAGGGVLVLGDAWFSGWEARVDGRPAPVLRVDHALRGVALEPGTHTVEFRFRPRSVLVGATVTAATLLALVGWAARPHLPAIGLGRRPGRAGGRARRGVSRR